MRLSTSSWLSAAIICVTALWALTNRAGYHFEAILGCLWLVIVVYAAASRWSSVVLLCHLAAVSFPLEYPMLGPLSLYRIALFLSLLLLAAQSIGTIMASTRTIVVYLTMLGMMVYVHVFFTREITVGSVFQLKDQYIVWIFYLMLGALCFKDQESYPFRNMLVIGVLVTALNVFFPSETLWVTQKNADDVRRMAMDTDPNYAAFTFFPGLAYLLARLMLGRDGLSGVLTLAGLALVIMYGILGTGSRGGLTAALAITLVELYFVLTRFPRYRRQALFLGATLFLAGGLAVLRDEVFQTRLASKGQGESSLDAYSSGRMEIWGDYVEALVLHPTLFGHSGDLVTQGSDPKYAHNTVLQLFYDFGLIGSLLWITLLASALRGLFRGRMGRFYVVEVGLTVGYGTALMFLTHGGDRHAAMWFGYLAARGAARPLAAWWNAPPSVPVGAPANPWAKHA